MGKIDNNTPIRLIVEIYECQLRGAVPVVEWFLTSQKITGPLS
jgi:hypothetical protein